MHADEIGLAAHGKVPMQDRMTEFMGDAETVPTAHRPCGSDAYDTARAKCRETSDCAGQAGANDPKAQHDRHRLEVDQARGW
jgi:hypothetical protein